MIDRAGSGWGAVIAEGCGTAVLVFVGAGAVCLDQTGLLRLGPLGIALAGGFTLCVLVFVLAPFSGAYLNPAVALAAVMVGRLPARQAARHLAVYLVGAAVGGVALRLLFPAALREVHLGAPSLAAGVSVGVAVTLEAVVTFAWVIAYGATSWSNARPDLAPLAVGGVYAASALTFGTLTGASGNPARAFGPSFAAGVYTDHGVYWLGPLIGAFVAALICLAAFRPRSQRSRLAPVPKEGAIAHYQEGVTLYRRGQLEEAAREFQSAAEERPGWAEPYYYIGMIYSDFGDEHNANAFFEAALYYREERRRR